MVAGRLSYQVTGWCIGGRVFDSSNSEAMLFAFLVAGLALTGWLAWKQDAYSAATSFARGIHASRGLHLRACPGILSEH